MIAEKLKAEKASIEGMVKDAEAQLASKLLQVQPLATSVGMVNYLSMYFKQTIGQLLLLYTMFIKCILFSCNAELQDQVGEQKLLHKALFGEMKTVKEELQELQLMVVEDEAQAAKYRM